MSTIQGASVSLRAQRCHTFSDAVVVVGVIFVTLALLLGRELAEVQCIELRDEVLLRTVGDAELLVNHHLDEAHLFARRQSD